MARLTQKEVEEIAGVRPKKITFARVKDSDDRIIVLGAEPVGRVCHCDRCWVVTEIRGSVTNLVSPTLRKLKQRLYDQPTLLS
jgi:hypothetical protein